MVYSNSDTEKGASGVEKSISDKGRSALNGQDAVFIAYIGCQPLVYSLGIIGVVVKETPHSIFFLTTLFL